MLSFTRLCIALAVILAVVAPSISLAATMQTTASVLAQARAAAGGDALDTVTGLYLSGHLTTAGIKGRFKEWLEPGSSSFRESDDAGPLSGSQGFDGLHSWNQDWSGLTWVDGGKAGLYGAIGLAYLANNSFLRPHQRGRVSFVGTSNVAGVSYDVLRATPPQGLPLQIWLDAQTHLVDHTVTTIGIQTTTTTLSDYRSVDGLAVPFHVHSVTDTGNESDAVVSAALANPPGLRAHLLMPSSRPTDFTIRGKSQTTVPIEIIDNHVYLNLKLNGKGPFRFAFDTGGSNLLDSDIAKTVGLNTSGSLQGGGAGSQTEGFSFAKISKVTVGDATVANQYFAVLPIRRGFSVSAGAPIEGLIGFEVLSRFVTTFDYGRSQLTLRLPSARETQSRAADVVPFVFNGTIPQVACKLDAVAGDCSIDTGSRASLTVLTPFAAAHPNLIPANVSAVGVDGFGIGGPALGRLGRLRSMQIGNTVLPQLIADFSTQSKGYFANPFIAANVGGGVWRRFSVTFDYPRQLMTLEPNSAFSQRDEYDRSGLFVISRNGQPTVLDARPGTPAAQAGLVRGDQLININGKPAASTTLFQIRKLFRSPSGTIVHLTVRNKTGAERGVLLKLRDYV